MTLEIYDSAPLEGLGEPRMVTRSALVQGALLASIRGARIPICTHQDGKAVPILTTPVGPRYLQPALAVADIGALARVIWSQLILTPPLSPLEMLDIAELLARALDADARSLGRGTVQGLLKAATRAVKKGAAIGDADIGAFQALVGRAGPPISIAQARYYVEFRASVSDEARQLLRMDHHSARRIPYCQAYEAVVGVGDPARQVTFLGYPSIAQVRAAKRAQR